MAEGREALRSLSSTPSLTLDNVLNVVKNVQDWRPLCTAMLDDDTLDEIQSQHDSYEDCLEDVVKRFLRGYGPSWRAVIWSLYETKEIQLAEHIRSYAEGVQDPTLTVDNVIRVIEAVAVDRRKEVWLECDLVPDAQLEKIYQNYSSEEQRLHACADFYVNCHYNSSWTYLCHNLLSNKEVTAARKTKTFIPQTDPTLTVDNVIGVMEKVTDDGCDEVWRWWFSDYLFMDIKSKCSSEKELLHTCSDIYVKCYHDSSWEDLARGLYEKVETAAVEEVRSYLNPRDPTLTTERLMELFAPMSDEDVDKLGASLDTPSSKREEFKMNYKDPARRKEAHLDYYVHNNPLASWTKVAGALRECRLPEQATVVNTYAKVVGGESVEDMLRMKDEAIYSLKQEIASLREERDATIYEIKELRAENEQLRSQLPLPPIKEEVEEKPLTLVPVKTEVKEEAFTVTKEYTTSAQPTAAWDLCGVEVCGEMTVVVHSSVAQQITWEGFGLKLHIDEGSLPAGIHQCTLTIKASLAGQYEFPDNSYLVSAIFWLRCEPMCKFTKPVTVEMQHCARSENVANLQLKFVRAVCSQKQLPYTFKELGGDFTRHSSYGVIEVNGFSGVAITQGGSEEREYSSQLFYLKLDQRNSCHIDFVVTWNVEAHLTAVKEEYEREGAICGLSQPVDFESDTIALDIPMEGISISGWTISPLMRPVVTKERVDKFRERKLTPCCRLKAEVSTGTKKISTLKHQVTMNGAKYPYNIFVIDLPVGNPQVRLKRDFAATGTYLHHHGNSQAELGPPPNKKSRLEEVKQLMESSVLHNHYADLSLAVSDNPDVFGSNLVQYGFATQTTVTGILSPLGVNNYQKANKLLEIVDSRFKIFTQGQSAREFFNNFVLILANKLERYDIAQALIATYKSKDPTYVSPLEETDTSSSAVHQPGRDH